MLQMLLVKPFVADALLKLSGEWLLRCQPLRIWIEGAEDDRLLSAAPLLAWASLLLDLSVPLLLSR